MSDRPSNSSAPLATPADVKRITVQSLASDPLLAERLVFKGGSALEMLYGIGLRASVDLDYSIQGDFDDAEIDRIKQSLSHTLSAAFGRIGVAIFDLHFEPKPRNVSPDLAAFWGGYQIRFKLIDRRLAEAIGDDPQSLRRSALAVGPAQRRTFEIDISRHECCQDKELHTFGGVAVLAYSPRLIVAEKLRAICQQMPEYRKSVRSPGSSPRARDFFDIHNLLDQFNLVLATREFLSLLTAVFQAKRVSLDSLPHITGTREFHRQDFQSVLDTVPPRLAVLTFDEYFDSVLSLVRDLQALRDE